MFVYRCDVCKKEVVPDQPKVYPLEPDGWFVKVGVAKLSEGRVAPKHTAPHACGIDCAKVLLEQGVSGLMQIERPIWQKADYVPKGSSGCRNCARIGVGKKCMYHGVKQEGWPEVASVKVAKAVPSAV